LPATLVQAGGRLSKSVPKKPAKQVHPRSSGASRLFLQPAAIVHHFRKQAYFKLALREK
jgi:hypothetical protein